MKRKIHIPLSLWHDIRDLFDALFAPCRDCLRGNVERCWQSQCAAFHFRDLARRILSTDKDAPRSDERPSPSHRIVENEILAMLKCAGRPLFAREIKLDSTCSKAVKSAAISRLARQRRVSIVTVRGERMVSISDKNKNPKNKDRRHQ